MKRRYDPRQDLDKILGLGSQYGLTFIKDAPFTTKQLSGDLLSKFNYGLSFGFETITSRDASYKKKFPGLTMNIGSTNKASYRSGSDIMGRQIRNIVGNVGETKSGIVDYLGHYKYLDPKEFEWAKRHTIGYDWLENINSLEGAIAWEKKHGQKISGAVYKLNVGSQGEGVYFGLKHLPEGIKGALNSGALDKKSILVQPRVKHKAEFRVVMAGNKAVDMKYRFGKHFRGFTEQHPLVRDIIKDVFGVRSGLPEMVEPVWNPGDVSDLSSFMERFHATQPNVVSAYDVFRTGKGKTDFMVVEAQKMSGSYEQAWVRWKIAKALTGRWPREAKIAAGVAGAVVGLAGIGIAQLLNRDSSDRNGRVTNNRPVNKIVGHHPGRMQKVSEDEIQSDFQSGHSYLPRFLSPASIAFAATMLFSNPALAGTTDIIKDRNRLVPELQTKLSLLESAAKKESIFFRLTETYRTQDRQNALYKMGSGTTSVKVSRHTSGQAMDIAINKGTSVSWDPKDYSRIGALGKSVGLEWGGDWKTPYDPVHFQLPKKIENPRFAQIRSVADYVAGLTETDAIYRKTVSNMLYETAVHESGGMQWDQQKWGKGKASSIFQVEAPTSEYLVKWSSQHIRASRVLTVTSGKTMEQLSRMSQGDLSKLMSENEKFAAGMARVKYMTAPGKIPETLGGRASYWSKYYQGTNNPAKTKQFLDNNSKKATEVKASALSNVVKKHIKQPVKTQGVGLRAHDNKVGHNVASQKKKLSVMKKILSHAR